MDQKAMNDVGEDVPGPIVKHGAFVIVRTTAAGAFYGTLTELDSNLSGVMAELADARRIWYWAGAATLSELAVRGTSDPMSCRIPGPVPWIMLPGVVEVIGVTPEARDSLESIPIWTAFDDNAESGTEVPAQASTG